MSSVQNISRHFMIENDHKLLEQISMKNLTDAPVCQQRILLRLQDYDLTIKFVSQKIQWRTVVADTLLRYSPENTLEIHQY